MLHTNKTYLHIQNRIASLKRNPVENANLIRKWERKARKFYEL